MRPKIKDVDQEGRVSPSIREDRQSESVVQLTSRTEENDQHGSWGDKDILGTANCMEQS